MATSTGEMRESLMDAIEAVKTGKLGASEACSVAKLAAQITASMAIENDIRNNEKRKPIIGHMKIGEEPKPIDGAPLLEAPGSAA